MPIIKSAGVLHFGSELRPWLMGQCNVFVRNRELLAREPFSITADEPFVEELTELVTRLATGGLLKANPALVTPSD